MCYYNGTKVTHSEFLRLKHLEKLVADYDFLHTSLYIGTNYVQAPVMRRYPKREDFELAIKDWGLLPPDKQTDETVREFRNNWMTLNAKAENLFESESGGFSMFAEPAMNRRCLVPSTHYFEMRHVQARGKKGQVLKKVERFPYLIRSKKDEVVYMAGLWNPNGKRGSNFTIITTEATAPLALIHNTKKRMPVILTEELAWRWMFGDLSKKDIQEIARFQYDEKDMQWYTVDKDLFKCADPMKEVLHPELPPLGEDVMEHPQIGLF